MDFFDHQDVARRKTGRLVALFIAAVICIIALVYVAFVLILDLGNQPDEQMIDVWNPMLLVYVSAGVTVVIAAASLTKISELSAGGQVVATSLGGTKLQSTAQNLQERQVLNVVEEMAIASGVPVPPVYLIEEKGINAFAAGYSPNDAVIGVTRGAIETLNRDELQGVIAHEFSHILNGDMRLNIRLMGVIFGIVVLSVIGYHCMRIAAYTGGGRSSRNKEGNIGAVFMLLGLALVVIGGIGSFFANCIKAAVSRQREFLADASAVQFTRNPEGISGALKKIGGWTQGSQLEHPEAKEVSHMLFGDGVKHFAGGLMATHPPLADRIKRIDPAFNGKFGKTHKLSSSELAAGASGFAGHASAPQVEADVVSQIGSPSAEHMDYAAKLLAALPQQVRDMAHESWGARALVYALLIDDDPTVSMKQMKHLAEHADKGVHQATQYMRPIVRQIGDAARLPLVDLATPALRELSPQQYEAFRHNVTHLVAADEKISLFEWTLQRILLAHLDPHFGGKKPSATRYPSLGPVKAQCAMLLSTLAYVGQSDPAAAQRAFEAGAASLQLNGLSLADAKQCGLRSITASLDALAGVTPQHKRSLIKACAATISADHEVTVREAELFRAVCDSLGAPAPPLLPGQRLV